MRHPTDVKDDSTIMVPTIDLRSDTVTKPTPAMLEAMMSCEIGDDVLGDHSAVTELEELAASLTGHEAGLFCPSGTMCNQIALAVHTRPGDSILLEEDCHILFYEVGAPAMFAQVVTRGVRAEKGVMAIEDLEAKFLQASLHTPGTTLLCLENTNNRHGGAAIPVQMMRQYREFADSKEIPIHLDGARVFNAAVTLGCDVKEITSLCDSVSICLSKGLGAPVGSVLLGSSEFIKRATLWRKRFGGGMRQSGLLAACGLVSLREIRHLLPEDHRRAKELNSLLQGLPGCRVEPCETVSNFVMVHTDEPGSAWMAKLAEHGVLCLAAAPHRLRLVLHHQITDEMVRRTAEAFHLVARG